MFRFLAELPANYNLFQVIELTRTHFPTALDVNQVAEGDVSNAAVYFRDNPPGDVALTAWRAAVAAHVPAPISQVETDRISAQDRLRQSITTLRQWSIEAAQVGAQGTNVTQAQHKALFTRFGKLCDGLADLILHVRADQ